MPRKKVNKRADGRFVATLSLGKFEGKQQQKFFYSTISQTDANRKRDEYKAELAAKGLLGGSGTASKNVRLGDWASRWLELKERKVKANTFASSYQRPVERYILPEFGNRVMNEILPIEVDKFLTDLGKKYSLGTVKKARMCLNAIYDTAIDNGIVFRNPCRKIDATSEVKSSEKRTYSQADVDRILDYCDSDAYGIYIRLFLELGLRCSELCGLKWSDFDLKEKVVYIRRAATDENGKTVVAEPKSKTSIRTLPLSGKLVEALCNLEKCTTDEYVVESTKTPGTPVNPKNFWNRYLATMPNEAQGEFPILSPHELRHTCGTLLYKRTGDIYAVSKYLGHASVDITARLYVHSDVDSLRTRLQIT